VTPAGFRNNCVVPITLSRGAHSRSHRARSARAQGPPKVVRCAFCRAFARARSAR